MNKFQKKLNKETKEIILEYEKDWKGKISYRKARIYKRIFMKEGDA